MTELDRYLAANPGMTARDWKGKGFTKHSPFDKHYVAPGEPPWDQLDRDEVRLLATRNKARFLSRGQRMAAGRDPGLVWDERSLSYRLSAEATPAPSLATEGRREGEGGQNVRNATISRPAAAAERNANTSFPPGTHPRARDAREGGTT
jgi:hypothetical protein